MAKAGGKGRCSRLDRDSRSASAPNSSLSRRDAGTIARLFFALFAWVNVMDPAATITSILFSFDILLSVSFAFRIFWIDDRHRQLVTLHRHHSPPDRPDSGAKPQANSQDSAHRAEYECPGKSNFPAKSATTRRSEHRCLSRYQRLKSARFPQSLCRHTRRWRGQVSCICRLFVGRVAPANSIDSL